MRIAVIGAGGVGGAFGGALAKAGADVTFVARGAHLRAMRANGLRIEGGRGETLIAPAQATDDPATIGTVDLVLFCVKLWDVETAGASIRPLIGPTTSVIPLQNGIDAAERLIPILGAPAVMGGVAQISATIAEPGVIRQTGDFMRLIFGELEGGHSARGEAFLALCQKAGFDATHSDQIVTELWMKFILLATNSALTAATRTPIGVLREDADIAPLFAPRLSGGRRGRPRQRRAFAGRRGAAGRRLHPNRATGDDGLHGARPDPREPDRTALAIRQSRRAWPGTRRADAGA